MHAVLDEAYHCALRVSSSTASRGCCPRCTCASATRSTCTAPPAAGRCSPPAATGLPVCVTVTLLDGLVYARSQFHHSANYRSVVAHGIATLVTDEAEKRGRADRAGGEGGRRPVRATPGRRPKRELAETAVLALPLREVSVRARTGGVSEDEADLDLPHWAGVLPLRLTARRSRAGRRGRGADARLPAAARLALARPGPLRGAHVVLEPLDLSHVDELFKATARPRGVAAPDHRASPRDRDRDGRRTWSTRWPPHHRGERVPWVQRSRAPGRWSARPPTTRSTPPRRSVAIGHTFLGRRGLAHRHQHRGEAAAADPGLRDAGRGTRGLAHRHPQRALPGGHRAARRHPRGRAPPPPHPPGRLLARHGPVRDARRGLARRLNRPPRIGCAPGLDLFAATNREPGLPGGSDGPDHREPGTK